MVDPFDQQTAYSCEIDLSHILLQVDLRLRSHRTRATSILGLAHATLRVDLFQLNSELKDGANAVVVRKATYVSPELFTDHFACVETNSCSSLISISSRGDNCLERSEEAFLVLLADAWALVTHDDGEQ